MPIEIVTNHMPRLLIDAYQLTEKERAEFDYLDWQAIDSGNDSVTFFRYKGRLYDLGEFMRIENNSELQGWHGYSSHGFFNGMLIKLCDDNNYIIVGQYFS